MRTKTLKIQAAQVTWSQMDRMEGSIEASDLGLAPGEVRRDALEIEDEVFAFKQSLRNDEGDIYGWKYVSSKDKTITVFND